ncbi:hypothetical protein [Zhihengliuella flava]|uniref:Uncharacterized protein n=1 Tax=Zhihengliuella flava TaxID=1285193 RepID=A0A931GFI3_9MICC|nr:hypothetical protein [Zhihengliuella flava]MBG6084692.1 hypothetical protein [Zhihengliuella flava]
MAFPEDPQAELFADVNHSYEQVRLWESSLSVETEQRAFENMPVWITFRVAILAIQADMPGSLTKKRRAHSLHLM